MELRTQTTDMQMEIISIIKLMKFASTSLGLAPLHLKEIFIAIENFQDTIWFLTVIF